MPHALIFYISPSHLAVLSYNLSVPMALFLIILLLTLVHIYWPPSTVVQWLMDTAPLYCISEDALSKIGILNIDLVSRHIFPSTELISVKFILSALIDMGTSCRYNYHNHYWQQYSMGMIEWQHDINDNRARKWAWWPISNNWWVF